MLVDSKLEDVPRPYRFTEIIDGKEDLVTHPPDIGVVWSYEELARRDWYVLNFDPIPEGYESVGTYKREFRGDPREAWQTWDVREVPATRDVVNEERDERFFASKTVTLADGRSIPVDTRGPQDMINIMGVYLKAKENLAAGAPVDRLFTGSDQVRYPLTTEQQVELALKVFNEQDEIIEASHDLKDRVQDGILEHAKDVDGAFDTLLSSMRAKDSRRQLPVPNGLTAVKGND